MTPLEYFQECTHGTWATIGHDTQIKLKDRVLYFQCSDGSEDWRANFDFPAVAYKKMPVPFKVHRGFLSRWQEIRDFIYELDFDRIVGYSHGAALALLAHEDRYFATGRQPETILFECPRVLFNPPEAIHGRFTKVTRYVSKGDIVTKVPPFFTHTGKEILLTAKTVRTTDSLLAYLSKHSPSVYRQRLNHV